MAVRNESVRLSLEDAGFSTGMARAAAATADLDKQLDSLDGNTVAVGRSMPATSREVDTLGTSTRKAGPDIDRLSGRLRIMADAAAVLGPSLLPIGAVAVPAIAGLASQMGFATVGALSLVAAAQGVGDALTAMEKARLDPTVANIEAAREAMRQIGPDARRFVREFQEIRPVLGDIRDAAADGWFPGLTSALGDLERIAPWLGDLFERIGERGGNLIAEGAEAFAGPQWAEFRQFVSDEAPAALDDLGKAVGNVASGFAELWMAFGPLNRDFSGWIVEATQGFEQWAEGLSTSAGFQEFVEYVRTNGPRVADLMVAVADALAELAVAAAPLGGPVLEGVTALLRGFAALADSDLGTPLLTAVAALSLLQRTTQAWGRVSQTSFGQVVAGQRSATAGFAGASRAARTFGADLANVARFGTLATDSSKRLGGQLAVMGRSAALMAGLAAASTGAADSIGLTNTVSLGLMGTIAGPWGAAIGSAIGLTMDLAAANDHLEAALRRADAAMQSGNIDAMRASLRELKDEYADQTEITGFGDTIQHAVSGLGTAFAGAWAIASGRGDEFVDTLDDIDEKANDVRQALAWSRSPLQNLTAAGSREEFRQALIGPLADTAEAAGLASAGLESFRHEVERVNGVLSQRAAVREYEASIDDLRKTIEQARKDGGRITLDPDFAAGREFGAALDRIAAASVRAAEGMKGMERVRFLRSAREDLIAFAQDLGKTPDQARRLADQLLKLDGIKPKPKVDLDVEEAERKARKTAKEITGLDNLKANPWVGAYTAPFNDGKKDVEQGMGLIDRMTASPTVNVTHNAGAIAGAVTSILNSIPDEVVYIRGVRTGAAIGAAGSADGGTVPKTGRPYADRHHYLLADGEEVISNRYGQADRHRALLKAINANRLADGGTAWAMARARLSERPLSVGAGRGGTVRHVVEVRVSGEMDLQRATAQIRQVAASVADDRIEAAELMSAEIERAG